MKLAIKIFMTVAMGAVIFSLAACSSNKPIPDDLSSKELIQRGQEAFEKNRSKEALRYFNAVTERYGSDPALYVEARYEIGHLYRKKKDYDNAAPVLEEIIALYAHYPVGTFPPAYEKLAKLELEKIPEDKLAAIDAKNREKAAKQLQAQQEAALRSQVQQDVETAADDDAPENTDATADLPAEESVADPK